MFTTWRIVRPLRARLVPFACFVKRGGGRVFKGSEVDLTSRRRYEGPRKEKKSCTREYVPNLRFDWIKTADELRHTCERYFSCLIYVQSFHKRKPIYNHKSTTHNTMLIAPLSKIFDKV